jgi:hypothetical protein
LRTYSNPPDRSNALAPPLTDGSRSSGRGRRVVGRTVRDARDDDDDPVVRLSRPDVASSVASEPRPNLSPVVPVGVITLLVVATSRRDRRSPAETTTTVVVPRVVIGRGVGARPRLPLAREASVRPRRLGSRRSRSRPMRLTLVLIDES